MKAQIRRRFYPFCFIFLLLSFSGPALGQEIPILRTFNSAWQHAGYPGEIIIPGATVNVRDSGALGNGTANDQPAISA
ncbi:MAG: hypothetical protein NTY10_06290, partial [Candidatus Omnitrophica bacterium]|nr:hypothetical protein [Candidatus Omnitrophota bacterium]